ncbi:hypothetical protein [Sulfuriroseicoccus oceanibius]|uniref:Uncharacterized protein n=1 Tax=Sulfuriroseicoccus oceanibius TaxID=2707525 RepID=A0A7T7JBH0_9BACT|nr:hypothetical protein [Sulfuriroseicoccus oceanibius]QQL44034.1 hypothetical protein G3M56_009015 [Sulfuriroseicoccus oceanibius]
MNVDRFYLSTRTLMTSAIAACCGIGLALAEPEDGQSESPSVLVLQDGGLLRGTMEGIAPDGQLNWLHDFSSQQVEFPKSAFDEIWFDRPSKPSADQDLVKLVDGTQFVGQITSVNENQLVMNSPTLGKRELERSKVESIRLGLAQGIGKHIAGGDTLSLDEWTGNHKKERNPYGSQVREVGGNFVFDGTYYPAVSMEAELPTRFVTTVQLDWRNHLDFRVTLGAGNEEGVSIDAPALHVIFSERSTRLQLVPVQKRNAHRSPTTLFQDNDVDWDSDRQRGSIELTLYVDRELQRVIAVADGKLLTDYHGGPLASQRSVSEDEASICSGSWLVLQQRGTGPLRLRKIEVREWDGVVVSYAPSADQSDSIVGLIDGDHLPGKLTAVKESSGGGRILEITQDGREPLELSEQLIAFVQMGGTEEAPAATDSGSDGWHIELRDGSRVAAQRITYAQDAEMVQAMLKEGSSLDVPLNQITRIVKSTTHDE